jgi:hypothetical protein
MKEAQRGNNAIEGDKRCQNAGFRCADANPKQWNGD